MNPRVTITWALWMAAALSIESFAVWWVSILLGLTFILITMLLSLTYALHRRFYRRAIAAGRSVGLPPPPLQVGGDESKRRWRNLNVVDTQVLEWMLISGFTPLLIGTMLKLLGWSLPSVPEISFVFLPFGILAGVVCIASMIDWYWLLPQVSGIVRDPPCRASTGAGNATRSWGSVTRVWLIYRWWAALLSMIAAAVTVGGVGLSIGHVVFVRLHVVGAISGEVLTPVGAIVAGLAAAIIAGVAGNLGPASVVLLDLDIAVGDLVHDRSDPQANGRRVTKHPLLYVVDVAVAGVKLIRVESSAVFGPLAFDGKKQDIKVPIREVDKRLESGSEGWSGCAKSCSGVNWYCDNNMHPERYLGKVSR